MWCGRATMARCADGRGGGLGCVCGGKHETRGYDATRASPMQRSVHRTASSRARDACSMCWPAFLASAFIDLPASYTESCASPAAGGRARSPARGVHISGSAQKRSQFFRAGARDAHRHTRFARGGVRVHLSCRDIARFGLTTFGVRAARPVLRTGRGSVARARTSGFRAEMA